MNLHHNIKTFEELIYVTSKHFNLPLSAIKKDYFITMILNNLSNSSFKDFVFFKGGTSLSKCYPNSIERFSEDIDLTYLPSNEMSDKQISKTLKSIENVLGEGFIIKKLTQKETIEIKVVMYRIKE